jgi:hypothetical protein
MEREEFRSFMAHLFSRYVRDRKKQWHGTYRTREEWSTEFEHLERLLRILKFIDETCDTDEEIYNTFDNDLLGGIPHQVLRGLRFNTKITKQTGILAAFDDYYVEIVSHMRLEDMPPEEVEIFRRLGSDDPETELRAQIFLARSRAHELPRRDAEIRLSDQLRQIEHDLEKQGENFKLLMKEHKGPKEPMRRWFKSLGKIAQGSALSIANVALAVGILPFPVAAETATWGALVSSATGVGMILGGVGEFRGE